MLCPYGLEHRNSSDNDDISNALIDTSIDSKFFFYIRSQVTNTWMTSLSIHNDDVLHTSEFIGNKQQTCVDYKTKLWNKPKGP